MITLDQGVVIAGRYTLVRPLARGGMGSVWIARHRDLEIDVTVKFMAPSLVAEAEARMRFEREARVAARLRSQYVVQVHDYGVEDETPYIIMELLKGESLSTRIEREGRLPIPAMARLLVQICKALRTAHEAGLVHRDLKPGNVFLALKDDDEVVKVLDFGIAKTGTLGEAQADTGSGVLLGSVHYMSPEQIRSSRTVDHRSDLWSVAVILYRALTGRLPFPGANLGDVLVRVCTDAAPLPSSAAPDLPVRIDRFFERALARDPDQRFQSAPELAEAFAAMAVEPAAPPPPAAPQPAPTPPVIAPAPPAFNPSVTVLTPAPTPFAPTPAPFAPPPAPLTPAPAPFAAPPHVRQTMRMDSNPLVSKSAPGGLDMTLGAPTVPWAGRSGTPRIIAPAPPPPALGPVSAAPQRASVTDTSPGVLAPTAVDRPSARRPWQVWVIAVTAVLAAMLGVALRSRATSSVVEATTAPSVAPPAPESAVVSTLPSAVAPVASIAPATSPEPRLTAAPSADRPPLRAPTPAGSSPRIGPKPRPNPLDRSD